MVHLLNGILTSSKKNKNKKEDKILPQKKLDTNDYIICDSNYIKCKKRPNNCIIIEMRKRFLIRVDMGN